MCSEVGHGFSGLGLEVARGHLEATPSTRQLGVWALWAPGWCSDHPWHPLLPRQRGSQPVRALWSSEFPACQDCKEGLELLCPHLPFLSLSSTSFQLPLGQNHLKLDLLTRHFHGAQGNITVSNFSCKDSGWKCTPGSWHSDSPENQIQGKREGGASSSAGNPIPQWVWGTLSRTNE